MEARLATFLPRFAALTAVALLSTATLTFAAEQQSSPSGRAPAAQPALATLIVPNVQQKAYVFAKGILEEDGFAWRVTGGTAGYAANSVVGQRPAPGTQVVDTGAPTVVLRLSRNTSYAETGEPDNAAPYQGTAIRFPGTPAPVVRPAPRPATPKPVQAPRVKTPKPKPAARPHARPVHRVKRVHKASHSNARPPAFAVPGAPKEPLDEMPLSNRARQLSSWVSAHPTVSAANVNYWLYQHAWIVTGAKFGWWHGADALRILIAVDQKVERRWGVGARSQAIARAALREVEASTR